MRRFLCLFCLILLLPLGIARAAEPELDLSGPETVYSQDEFPLYILSQWELTRISFTLSFDTENLLFYGIELPSGGTWETETAGNCFTLTGKAGGALPYLRFQLRDVSPGTSVWVMLSDIVVTAQGQERKLEDIRWEYKVASPVSGENYLSALKISDAGLQPAFSPYVQQYTATVSYHVGSVDVTAVAKDANAHIAIHNPELKTDGTTDITVTVTAQNGQSRVYTISVTREDDPNRPLSSQCALSELTVNGFLLSPEFDSLVTDYVVWLPYEVSRVEIEATPKDSRATVTVEGNKGLEPGADNPITVTCRAEDGTEKTYTVIAKRAAPHTEPATQDGLPSENATAQIPSQDLLQGAGEEIPAWTYGVLGVAAITGCAAFAILLSDRKK